MKVYCVWEHNGNDTLLYAVDYIGAYTRGESLEIAKAKMPTSIPSATIGDSTSNPVQTEWFSLRWFTPLENFPKAK